MLKTSWSDAQYRKYKDFTEEKQREKDAMLWKGNDTDARKQPPKLQFKQRLWVTGPAAENTIVRGHRVSSKILSNCEVARGLGLGGKGGQGRGQGTRGGAPRIPSHIFPAAPIHPGCFGRLHGRRSKKMLRACLRSEPACTFLAPGDNSEGDGLHRRTGWSQPSAARSSAAPAVLCFSCCFFSRGSTTSCPPRLPTLLLNPWYFLRRRQLPGPPRAAASKTQPRSCLAARRTQRIGGGGTDSPPAAAAAQPESWPVAANVGC